MIYDKKAFQNENPENPQLYQKIIDALPIPIFYRDVNGVYQACNKAHEKLTGRTKDQIVGISIYDIHPKDMADIYSRRDQELLANPDVQVYETQIKSPDGILHNMVFNKAVIRDSNDNIIGIVGSINDISELKRTEFRLKKAQESMEVSSHMLHKINLGIVLIDQNHRVVDSNESFARLMGEESMELFETIPGLKGADVGVLVPEVIYKMLTSIMASGEDILERDIKFQNRLLHVSVVTLYPNKVVGAV
ncbi:MAG: PAS domain S-box protein, partial [Bacteroidia bacterium]|nr:PAS domain S-box protein [Bacteroidia bacterium]